MSNLAAAPAATRIESDVDAEHMRRAVALRLSRFVHDEFRELAEKDQIKPCPKVSTSIQNGSPMDIGFVQCPP
jgi:hypothetical protein